MTLFVVKSVTFILKLIHVELVFNPKNSWDLKILKKENVFMVFICFDSVKDHCDRNWGFWVQNTDVQRQNRQETTHREWEDDDLHMESLYCCQLLWFYKWNPEIAVDCWNLIIDMKSRDCCWLLKFDDRYGVVVEYGWNKGCCSWLVGGGLSVKKPSVSG